MCGTRRHKKSAELAAAHSRRIGIELRMQQAKRKCFTPSYQTAAPKEMARPRPLQLKPKIDQPNDGILNLVTNMEKHVQMLADRYSSLDGQNGALFTKNGIRASIFDSARAINQSRGQCPDHIIGNFAE